MTNDAERYEQYAEEGNVLAQIGRALFTQQLEIEVRLPRALAEKALQAWLREDPPLEDKRTESADQARVRYQSGALALMGLYVEEQGLTVGNEIVVRLHAWQIGDALRAADELGLLADVFPPRDDAP